MLRGIRVSVIIAIGASLIAQPLLHAHGGGGHGGGGHMGGGGHFGGGGGHFGGGGGHFGGGGGGHFGGAQMGGGHFGGVQHNPGFSGQHNGIHSGTTQSFGTQHLGTQQHNATFYQHHGLHNSTGTSSSSGSLHHGITSQNFSGHQGSQFLNQHSLQNGSVTHSIGLNHSGHAGTFLNQHGVSHVSTVTTAHHGNFLSNQGNLNNHHFGLNNGFHGANSAASRAYLHSGSYYRHHGYGYGYGSGFWGYPYYGYGFGLGLGLGYGLGYGLGFGGLGYYGGYGLGYYGGYGLGYYGGYGFNNYGYGLNGYGYGLNGYGYGLGGYGYGMYNGYNNWGCLGYQPYCAYQPVTYGYAGSLSGNNTYPYSNVFGATGGFGTSGLAYAPLGPTMALGAATATDAAPVVPPSNGIPAPPSDTTSGAASGLPTADEFARIGEIAFKTRDYKGAVRAWRHGLVDDPQNSVLLLMFSQALLATQQFSESAGAIQTAMQSLPEDKWDIVIKNFRDLYGKGEDYTTHMRALEKAAREKPEEPATRFLLGYHYGFLGYPAEAVKQLQKCVALMPQDEIAQKLLRMFDDKLPKQTELPTPSQSPAGNVPSAPANNELVPPPPLNTEPSNAAKTKAPADSGSPAKPENPAP